MTFATYPINPRRDHLCTFSPRCKGCRIERHIHLRARDLVNTLLFHVVMSDQECQLDAGTCVEERTFEDYRTVNGVIAQTPAGVQTVAARLT